MLLAGRWRFVVGLLQDGVVRMSAGRSLKTIILGCSVPFPDLQQGTGRVQVDIKNAEILTKISD